jgi:hypothetical protein
VIGGENNPTIFVVKGETYTFTINAAGHPFWIQTVSGAYSTSDVYDTGITNLGTDDGVITWVVDSEAPSELYYVCQFHSSMQGSIVVLNSNPPADGSYIQPISTIGMKTDDNPFVDIDMSSVNFADVEDRLTDWALVYRGEATADTVTFYATEEPADDIPVKIRR